MSSQGPEASTDALGLDDFDLLPALDQLLSPGLGAALPGSFWRACLPSCESGVP